MIRFCAMRRARLVFFTSGTNILAALSSAVCPSFLAGASTSFAHSANEHLSGFCAGSLASSATSFAPSTITSQFCRCPFKVSASSRKGSHKSSALPNDGFNCTDVMPSTVKTIVSIVLYSSAESPTKAGCRMRSRPFAKLLTYLSSCIVFALQCRNDSPSNPAKCSV